MNNQSICPLCDREIQDHTKIFIDGDEVHACYGDDWAKAGDPKDMVMQWMEKMDEQQKQKSK